MYFLKSLFLVLISSGLIHAQYNSSSDSDAEALRLLEKISQAYQTEKIQSVDFSLDIELPGQAKETQKGMLIQKGEKFFLDVEERQIVSNGEAVWLYLKDLNEVQINDADFDEEINMMSPTDLFKIYKSDKFVFAISDYPLEDGVQLAQIECKPLDSESEYSKMRLTLTKDGDKVIRMKVFAKDGSRFTMHINKLDRTIEDKDSYFNFDASQYEGIFVEDLRF